MANYGAPFTRELAWHLLPIRPKISVDHAEALALIDEAIGQFGLVPNDFPAKD